MASLPHVAASLEATLTDITASLARDSGFCQRRSKLTAAVFVQTLVLGWWQHPAATLHQLCQMAAIRGVRLTPQGLDQRFTEAGATLLHACLESTLSRLVTRRPAVSGLLDRFTAVEVLDSTTIRLPDALAAIWQGCGGKLTTNTQAALKLAVRLDLRRGNLVGLDLVSGRTQDRATAQQHTPVAQGALRIADQGFWSLDVFRAIASRGGAFLSRYHSQTRVVLAGKPLDLPRWLASQPAMVDVAVELGLRQRLPVRLLAMRVPQAVADTRRRRIRKLARVGGHPVPKRTLALAGWTLLVTNVPADQMSVAEAEVLRRLRWQIELLFKLWKQQGQLATSRSTQPWRILCEVYAKLIAVVLQQGMLLLGNVTWQTHTLVAATALIRMEVIRLAHDLDRPRRLRAVLRDLILLLGTVGAPAKRRKHPSAAQLCTNPDLVWA